MRLRLDDLRSTLRFEIPAAAVPARAESIDAAGGAIAWLATRDPAATLLTWDGRRGAAFALERWAFGLAGFELEEGADGEVRRVVPAFQETVLDGFQVSPDGRRVAWDVNLVAGMTPDSGGTIHRRHLVFAADLDGRNEETLLDERFAQHSLFADADQTRHLFAWSRVHPDRLYLTRLRIGQLTSEETGPYTLELRTGRVDSTRAFSGVLLAFSPDETRLAHTPNDQSCCGGLNYTNNRVLVRDLATGRDQVVLDEWAQFGDSLVETPDHPGGLEDYLPVRAAFSPDGRTLAVTIEHWSDSLAWRPDAHLTWIRALAAGDPGRVRPGRVLVGWRDAGRVILGRPRVNQLERGVLDSLFVYDLARDRETPLSLTGVMPITIGP